MMTDMRTDRYGNNGVKQWLMVMINNRLGS
jgi:hypothetical protein